MNKKEEEGKETRSGLLVQISVAALIFPKRYLGQNQQLNMTLSTKGTNSKKHRDDFPAIMYSMKIGK